MGKRKKIENKLSKVGLRKARYELKHHVGVVEVDGDGRMGIIVNKYDRVYLEPVAQERVRPKYLKPLLSNPRFTVYMGYAVDDFDEQVTRARNAGVEAFKLEAVEDWGYDFIAVRNRELTLPDGHKWAGQTLRWNPLDEIQLAPEYVIKENDLRDTKVYPSSFLISAQEIEGALIPAMIQAQLHTLTQVVDNQAVEVA